jgi:hypothetical protein
MRPFVRQDYSKEGGLKKYEETCSTFILLRLVIMQEV